MNAHGKLILDDIADLRAYERERNACRTRIIELKKRRRVAIGPIVTVLFENRDTVRFQVQEMARAERMLSDDAIQAELDVYNPLIPSRGQLSATLFIELTDESSLRDWLPKLVGVERSVELRLGPHAEYSGPDVVRCMVEEAHQAQLTREDVTASVHYLRFELTLAQIAHFATAPVEIAVTLPAYSHVASLAIETRQELSSDLHGG
jgi:hypothetical protein